jgi:predicted dehydrogenase
METLKGCLAGCGYFGRIQLDGWARVTGARIEAVCDADPGRAEAAARDFGAEGYVDVERMLKQEQPDFLDIATRPATHLPLVWLAAGLKVDVLCQKPMANTWKEAVEMTEVARLAGIRLMMNENWRWQPWYRRIREILAEGGIGRPVFYRFHHRRRDGFGPAPYPNQPYFKEMPRLILFETLVHFLDTARFLFGEIEEIYCQTSRLNPVIAGEDLAVMMLRHGSGLRGVIDGHRFAEPGEEGPAMCEARIEGADGVVSLESSGAVWLASGSVFDPAGIPGYKGDSCRAAQQHFVDCLRSGAPFETDAREYLKTVAAVEAAYESAAQNRPVAPAGGL